MLRFVEFPRFFSDMRTVRRRWPLVPEMPFLSLTLEMIVDVSIVGLLVLRDCSSIESSPLVRSCFLGHDDEEVRPSSDDVFVALVDGDSNSFFFLDSNGNGEADKVWRDTGGVDRDGAGYDGELGILSITGSLSIFVGSVGRCSVGGGDDDNDDDESMFKEV